MATWLAPYLSIGVVTAAMTIAGLFSMRRGSATSPSTGDPKGLDPNAELLSRLDDAFRGLVRDAAVLAGRREDIRRYIVTDLGLERVRLTEAILQTNGPDDLGTDLRRAVVEFLRTVQVVGSYCRPSVGRRHAWDTIARAEATAGRLIGRFRDALDATECPLDWKPPICRLESPPHHNLSSVELRHGLPVLTLFHVDGSPETLGALHAAASLLVQYVPGLDADLAAATGWASDPWLPKEQDVVDGPVSAAAWSAWRTVLLSDAMTVQVGGVPAAERFVAVLADVEHPTRVLEAGHSHHFFTAHPPAHLRIHLMVRQLETMGARAAAEALLHTWNTAHGFATDADPSPCLLVPRQVSMEAVPPSPVVELGARTLQHALHAPLPTLQGQSLSALLHPIRHAGEAA